MDRISTENEEKRMKECSFAPKLSATPLPTSKDWTPLHKRLAEIERKRRYARLD